MVYLSDMKLTSILFLLLAVGPAAKAADGASVDLKARAILEEMNKAYKSVRTLEQETVYSGGSANTARLFFERPNRISLDMLEPSGVGGLASRKVLCDGKN